jgi:hypothetical protein
VSKGMPFSDPRTMIYQHRLAINLLCCSGALITAKELLFYPSRMLVLRQALHKTCHPFALEARQLHIIGLFQRPAAIMLAQTLHSLRARRTPSLSRFSSSASSHSLLRSRRSKTDTMPSLRSCVRLQTRNQAEPQAPLQVVNFVLHSGA